MRRKVVITGASRGIGAMLADLGTEAGDDVQAAMRTTRKASDLQLDVDDPQSIDEFATTLERRFDHIDILINNAGVDARAFGATADARGPFELDGEHVLAQMRTNVVGPMLVTRALLPLLRQAPHAKIINMSSQLGSMEVGRVAGSDVGYNASKAALNALTVKTAALLESEGITTIAMHPGWVKTDMGGPGGELEVRDSALAIWATIDALEHGQNGAFLRGDGSVHPW